MHSEFSWDRIMNPGISWVEILQRFGVAILIGAMVGIEREHRNRPAGMRTHILVCLGASMVAVMECLLNADIIGLDGIRNTSLSITRLSAQVISGIGFLGAGTIFVAQKKIVGLTTAASLWTIACLGLVIGYGYYLIAVISGILVLIVLFLFRKLIHFNTVKHVEIKFTRRSETLDYINDYFLQMNITVLDVDFHIETFSDSADAEKNLYTNLYTLHLPPKLSYTDIVMHLSEKEGIQTVRTRSI